MPSVVLAEALTGDHRRDFHANRLLRTCQVRDVDEAVAREAACLRAATGRAREIAAVDAIVVAFAGASRSPLVLTSGPRDIRALAEHATTPVGVVAM